MTEPARRRLRARALALAVAAVCAVGCATSLDFDRARRMLRRNPAPVLPEIQADAPAADLPGPERLRASSGELRKIPLLWDPILVGDVGGYQVERARDGDGPFEPIVAVPGALNTSYIDRIEAGEETAAEAEPDAEPEAAGVPEPDSEPQPAEAAPLPRAEGDDGESPEASQDPGGERPGPESATAEAEAPFAPDAEVPPTPEEFVMIEPATPLDRSRGADGRTLYYRVRAFTNSGRLAREASEVASATTALLPAPPEDLRAYSHQPRRVPLSWHSSDDRIVAGYRVQRSPTSLGPFETIAELEGRHTTTFTDENLGDLRVFYYRVAGVNADGGEGVPTEPVRVVTKPEPLPPVGLRVVKQRLGANELTWDPNVEPDISEYRLLRQREGARAPEIVASIAPPDALAAVDTAVGAGEKLHYSLLAFDDDGLESAVGEPVTVASEGYDLRATASATGVELTWNPRRDEGFRAAQILRGGILDQREFPRVAGSRFVDASVKPGRRYRYSVALVDAAGRLAPRSEIVEVAVPEAD